MADPVTEKTLEEFSKAAANAQGGFSKDVTDPTANFAMAQNYFWSDLRTAVHILAAEFRKPTFLLNITPRVQGRGGDAIKFKIFKDLGSDFVDPFLSEGLRGEQIDYSTDEAAFVYRHLAEEAPHTFESELAGTILTPDARGMKMRALAQHFRLTEEFALLFANGPAANGGVLLGKPTVSLTFHTSGGAINDSTTVHVKCVPLTAKGLRASSVANGVARTRTRQNMDGSTSTVTCGSGKVTDDQNDTTGSSGSNANSVGAVCSIPTGPVMGYAWYWGPDATTNCKLGAITKINSILITTPVGTGEAVSALTAGDDDSVSTLEYNGLITQLCYGGYTTDLATGTPGTGTPLTADGKGHIEQFDTVLQAMWDDYFVAPDEIWINSQQQKDLNALVPSTTGGNMLFMDIGSGGATIMGGGKVGSYRNAFTQDGQDICKIVVHPDIPEGNALFVATKMPNLPPGVNAPFTYYYQRDYYGIEWMPVTRRYDYSINTDGCPALEVPFVFHLLRNIARVGGY